MSIGSLRIALVQGVLAVVAYIGMLAVTLLSEQLIHEPDRYDENIYEVYLILLVGHVRGDVHVC